MSPLTDTLFPFTTLCRSVPSDSVMLTHTVVCGYCVAFAPVYEKIAQTFKNEDSVRITRIDASKHKIDGPSSHDGLILEHVIIHDIRSEEHTSELQSLIRISYAVSCLNKKNTHNTYH